MSGLTLPNWPQMTLGFEQDYRDGSEALTDWGASGTGTSRNLAPTSESVHEAVNIIKFDLDHEVAGVAIEERFRGEFYNLNTHYTNLDARDTARENAHEGDSYFQGANTLRLEKKFNDWLFGSAGYLYSHLDADASFTDSAFNHAAINYIVPQITLEKQSHVFNLNGLVGPFDGLIVSAGVESEWTRQYGYSGTGSLLGPIFTNGTATAPITGAPVLSTLSSDYDEESVTEDISLRYSKVPFTAVFAEARLQQQSIGQTDDDFQPVNDFLQSTAFSSQLSDFRIGFDTSPWRMVNFEAQYRRYQDNSDYQNNFNAPPPIGYPGFIRERDLLTDEAEVRLALAPARWFKTSLSYQYLTTDYSTVTYAASHRDSPGGDLVAGESVSQIYSVNATVIPRAGFYLSTTLSYQPTRAISANNNSPAVVPYRGDIYSAVTSANVSLGTNSTLFADYSFSEADYAQNNFAASVPVGIQYQEHAVQVGLTRRFNARVSGKIQYGYYFYEEPSSGGAANFTANSIFATLTFKGP